MDKAHSVEFDMSDFRGTVELTAANLGTRVLVANDEFFGPKESLILPQRPVFIEGKFTDRGKWMDGWETRRRRTPGNDWCILRLGLPGMVRRAVVDTSHFHGNQPEFASLEGFDHEEDRDFQDAEIEALPWFPVMDRSPLAPNSENVFEIVPRCRVTHLRLNIFPDGGVARLRVFGEPLADFRRLRGRIDLAAMENGGSIAVASDMNFGHAHHLIAPGEPENMGQGWETRRRRGPGHDWCLLRLAAPGRILRAEVATTHFKGNFPESCSIEGILHPGEDVLESNGWFDLQARVGLRPDALHSFDRLGSDQPVSHVRFNIFPDGGVARLRLWGEVLPEAYAQAGLRYLNSLSRKAACDVLGSCCGSSRWAQALAERRPFGSLQELREESDSVFDGLESNDLLEAFATHPRIGEDRAAPSQSRQAARWSRGEQSRASESAPGRLETLHQANQAYEARFGFKFIICATGKDAGEILSALGDRLSNERETELSIAAGEERKICHLRLEKLFQP